MATEVKDAPATETHPVTGEPLTDREKFLVEKFNDFQRTCLDFFKTKGIEPAEAVAMVDAFNEKIQKIVMKKAINAMINGLIDGDIKMGVAAINTETGAVETILGEKPPEGHGRGADGEGGRGR